MQAFLLLLTLMSQQTMCFSSTESSFVKANPIRKVVNLLQAMQAKVTEEGAKEKKLFEKFMCYCKNSGGNLKQSIADANTKIPQIQSEIEADEAKAAQLKEEISQAQDDRAAAKNAMKEATQIREKEAAEFAKYKSDTSTDVKAISKAVAALEAGMAGGFLQTATAPVLRKIVQSRRDMDEQDRHDVLAFLSGSENYSPQAGQITGILKEMGDDMARDLKAAIENENSAIASYEDLMQAKKKEVEALSSSIEKKLTRQGEVGVKIVQMKNELTDTEEALIADQKFLKELEEGCSKKEAEWAERQKTRAEELVALADTIRILNDDDALELFKKTLPGASSFMQVSVGKKSMQKQALALLSPFKLPQVEFIALALQGKKVGFEKVIAMIDEMVATLKEEQAGDDKKKEYCAVEFDQADDKKKALERTVSDEEAAMEQAEAAIATLKDEIAALTDAIAALDKSVAEATAQRKAEHAEFTDLMAADNAAKDLLNFAKNRLNKFYNPKLYKPPPKRELSEMDRITVAEGGTLAPTNPPAGIAGTGITVLSQVNVHDQNNVAPPPPPETFGAYTKKTEGNNGVVEMINLLIKDLDKDMTEAQQEEKDAQANYERFMRDSAEKRTQDAKMLSDKQSAKADTEGELQAHTDAHAAAGKELMATNQYIASLHAECDWLVKYFDARKQARADEVDALGKAKAVLSGADYSLLQTNRHFLGKY